MISWFVSLSPTSGSVLTAQGLETALDSLSSSLCPFPAHALSLSLKNESTLKKKIFFNVSLFLRERGSEIECGWGRGREREGDTESEAGSRLWAVSMEPHMGVELMNHKIMT